MANGGVIVDGQQVEPTTPIEPSANNTGDVALGGARKLGPTEFKGLTEDLTRQFNEQGITDINEINSLLEKNYFIRQGEDVFLKANTPTIQGVVGGLSNLDPGRQDEINLDESVARQVDVSSGPSPIETFAGNIYNQSLTAIEQALLANDRARQEALEAERIEAEAAKDQALAGLEGAFAGETAEASLDRLNKRFKVEENQKALTEILNQINQHQAALEQGLINIEGQPIALELQIGQQAQLKRQAAATMTALSAKASVIQGQLSFARDMVNQYYGAAREDRLMEISRYETLLKLASDDLVTLKQEERDAIDRQRETLLNANARERAEKDRVINLMLENPEVWSKAGVSLDMNLEQITAKMAEASKAIQDEALLKSSVVDLMSKYVDAGINPTDTLEQARAKLAGSKIYQQQTRLAGGSGGSSGGGTVTPTESELDLTAFLDNDGNVDIDKINKVVPQKDRIDVLSQVQKFAQTRQQDLSKQAAISEAVTRYQGNPEILAKDLIEEESGGVSLQESLDFLLHEAGIPINVVNDALRIRRDIKAGASDIDPMGSIQNFSNDFLGDFSNIVL